MSLADELLEQVAAQAESRMLDPSTEPHIVVNPDRTVTVPEILKNIAVQHDHNIETVTIDCPRYWDGHDLSEMNLKVVWQRSDNHREPHPVENLRIDEDDPTIMHFEWTISKHVTLVPGMIKFSICGVLANADGEILKEWHTHPNTDMFTREGLDCSGEEIAEENPDILEGILVRLAMLEEKGGGSGGDVDLTDYATHAFVETYVDRAIQDMGQVGGFATEHFVDQKIAGLAVEKTEDMTQPVGIDLNGRLWVAPIGGGSGGCLLTTETITIGEVGDIPVTGIELDYSTMQINQGDSFQIAATVLPANATNNIVKWRSSDETIATVVDGYVTGIANGSVTITAYSLENNNITATCVVTVVAVSDGGKIYLKDVSPTGTGCLLKSDETEYTMGRGKYWKLNYTEGMHICTVFNSNYILTTYPPIRVVDGDESTVIEAEYTAVSGTYGTYETTLTGFSPSAEVYVNLAEFNTATIDLAYYIEGGKS